MKAIDPVQCEAVNQLLRRAKQERHYAMLTEFMLGDGRDIFVGLSPATREELSALHVTLAGTLCDHRPFASCQQCGNDAPCRRAKAR